LLKILIVDDDKLIRWSLKEIFIQEGYDADAEASTAEALGRVKNEPFDLIVADLEINEQDGIEMLKRIRALQPAAQMIILSAHPKKKIESLLGGFPVNSIVEKPFQSDQIRVIARNALDTSKEEREGKVMTDPMNRLGKNDFKGN
jgi:DNA-binding NtrC family response regulator